MNLFSFMNPLGIDWEWSLYFLLLTVVLILTFLAAQVRSKQS
jgi:hypothetical protein